MVSWGYLEAEGHPTPNREHPPGAAPPVAGHEGPGRLPLVPAAIAFQERHGWDRLRGLCHDRAVDTLRRVSALTGLPPACGEDDFLQMAILPFPARDPALLQETLFRAHRIEVPVTAHGDGVFVQVSIQAYNGQADCDALVEALGLEERDVRRG